MDNAFTGDPASLCGGRRCVVIVNPFLFASIVKLVKRKALAKFVPAAAVIRIEQVLFIGTRR